MISDSKIQKFYENTNVFITGGTGFIGRVLIEKLLRSTQVSIIYLLIRDKKGKDWRTRLDEIFNNELFNCLKNVKPTFKDHIIGILGDCSLPDLGLSATNRQTLIKNVNIVIHAAATVNLDENLKLAYDINVRGTKDILELSKQIKNLKSFIHVSTAYSNCHLEEIDERIYNYSANHKVIGELLERLTNNEASQLTEKIVGNWPNTYTFTKALAESLIGDLGKDLPIGIFRPGIVLSTYKEPIEGWIDNYYGPTGVVAAVSSGLLKVMCCNSESVANLVPVDTCAAGILAVSWDVSNICKEKNSANEIRIYNYTSTENPVTWGEFILLIVYAMKLYPTLHAIRLFSLSITDNYLVFQLKRFYYDFLLAVFLDFLSLLSGRKTKLIRMYKKIEKVINVINFFAMRDWKFQNNNTRNLWEKMNEFDKKLFPMSTTTVSWLSYFKSYFIGVRIYLLNDSLNTLDDARVRQKRFEITHYLFYFLIYFLLTIGLWLIILNAFKIFPNDFQFASYQIENNTCIRSL